MKNQKKDCFTFVPGCNCCNTKYQHFPFFKPCLKVYPNEPCWRIPHVLEVCKSWIITTQPPALRNPGSFSLFKGFENNDQWSDNNYNTTSSPTKLFMNQTPFQNYDNNDTRLLIERSERSSLMNAASFCFCCSCLCCLAIVSFGQQFVLL